MESCFRPKTCQYTCCLTKSLHQLTAVQGKTIGAPVTPRRGMNSTTDFPLLGWEEVLERRRCISYHLISPLTTFFFHQLVHFIFVPGVLLGKFLTAGPPYAKPGSWALSCSLPKSISGVPFLTPDPPVLRHGGQQHWAATCTRSELKHLQ